MAASAARVLVSRAPTPAVHACVVRGAVRCAARRPHSSSAGPSAAPAGGGARGGGGGGSGAGTLGLSLVVGAAGGAVAYHTLLGDLREHPAYWSLSSALVTPALRLADAESAHRAAIAAASAGLAPREPEHASPPSLRTRVWGLDFPSAVGLAAGFDKHAEAPAALLRMGFGFVEVGTVTPLPQEGNPRPRVFRLPEDEAVINRYGFNSDGLAAASERMEAFRDAREAGGAPRGPVGVNIGKNKEGDAVMDFTVGAMRMAQLGDYLVVNVSSPNTPGLRALQRVGPLRELVSAVQAAARKSCEATQRPCPPVLVKIAPDVDEQGLADIATVVKECGVDGVIVSNTTVARPLWLQGKEKAQAGGLSGVPVRAKSTEVLRELYRLTEGKVPLVGVGGITCGADAYDKIRAGASVVQLYTALAFQGPAVVRRVKRELAALLAEDGFASVAEAVGADHREMPAALAAAIEQARESAEGKS